MSLPKISIVTPSYNQGAYIEQTIQSVLAQDYPNLEYFVIDGGSTDQTTEILRRYEGKITRWISEKDSGQSEAINKGFRMATGDIISWLCSDDLYVPGALHRVAELFQSYSDSIMIHGKTILFDEKGKEQIKGADLKDLSLRYFSVIPYPQPSSFFKRKLLDEQGLLREDLHFAMDHDLMMRAVLNYRLTPVEDIFSRYRLHRDSKTVMQQRKFEGEWVFVFSKFLRSVNGGNLYFQSLKDCGLYDEGSDRYMHQRIFSASELKVIVLYYLEFMAHLSYRFLEKQALRLRLSKIKQLDPHFYNSQNLGKIAFRSLYLPTPFIRIFRKFSGS